MLSVKNFALTCGIMWGGLLCIVSLTQLIWPSYGGAFLSGMESIYPGYQGMEGLPGTLVLTLYGFFDGLLGGGIFSWLYNRLNS